MKERLHAVLVSSMMCLLIPMVSGASSLLAQPGLETVTDDGTTVDAQSTTVYTSAQTTTTTASATAETTENTAADGSTHSGDDTTTAAAVVRTTTAPRTTDETQAPQTESEQPTCTSWPTLDIVPFHLTEKTAAAETQPSIYTPPAPPERTFTRVSLPDGSETRAVVIEGITYIEIGLVNDLVKCYGGNALDYHFSNLQPMNMYVTDTDYFTCQGFIMSVWPGDWSVQDDSNAYQLIWYEGNTLGQPVYDPAYWTYTSHTFTCNDFNISPVRAFVWEWDGAGPMDSCLMRLDDMVTVIEEIKALI